VFWLERRMVLAERPCRSLFTGMNRSQVEALIALVLIAGANVAFLVLMKRKVRRHAQARAEQAEGGEESPK
jgi:hypothetical protein